MLLEYLFKRRQKRQEAEMIDVMEGVETTHQLSSWRKKQEQCQGEVEGIQGGQLRLPPQHELAETSNCGGLAAQVSLHRSEWGGFQFTSLHNNAKGFRIEGAELEAGRGCESGMVLRRQGSRVSGQGELSGLV